MAFRLVNVEVKDLTPELAKEFSEMEASPTERELKDKRLRYLLDKAKAGQLVTFHWSRARIGNKLLRMNGQHSSKMLCSLNGSFPTGLKVCIEDFEVDSMDDLPLLFRQYDQSNSVRSKSDNAFAYQGAAKGGAIRDLNKNNAKRAVSGVAWYRRIVLTDPVPKGDDVFSLFNEEDLHSFIRWIAGTVHEKKTYELAVVPVIGAMHATFVANSDEARAFWKQVVAVGEYEDNEPTTMLAKWLRAIGDKELKVKEANHYQGCIYAWNAHRQEKQIKNIKDDAKKGFLEPIE
jgi:hypothetical protein